MNNNLQYNTIQCITICNMVKRHNRIYTVQYNTVAYRAMHNCAVLLQHNTMPFNMNDHNPWTRYTIYPTLHCPALLQSQRIDWIGVSFRANVRDYVLSRSYQQSAHSESGITNSLRVNRTIVFVLPRVTQMAADGWREEGTDESHFPRSAASWRQLWGDIITVPSRRLIVSTAFA